MSEPLRMWIEIIFNIGYLVVVWWLVIAMWRWRSQLEPANRRLADWITASFALLALGDTGHVGFRVWAYALGSLDSRVSIFGMPVSLVGAGALATAITVTLFYMGMLEAWRLRFKRQYGTFEYILLLAAVTRLFMMTLPGNEWQRVVPPQPWSTFRNIPLMVQGLGLAYLILHEAVRKKDQTFRWIGISILVSYACYIPVILFVQQAPLVGMLMIPKTMAYVAVGLLAYTSLYRQKPVEQPRRTIQKPAAAPPQKARS